MKHLHWFEKLFHWFTFMKDSPAFIFHPQHSEHVLNKGSDLLQCDFNVRKEMSMQRINSHMEP